MATGGRESATIHPLFQVFFHWDISAGVFVYASVVFGLVGRDGGDDDRKSCFDMITLTLKKRNTKQIIEERLTSKRNDEAPILTALLGFEQFNNLKVPRLADLIFVFVQNKTLTGFQKAADLTLCLLPPPPQNAVF